ncbi:ribonuclease P protein component [Pseudozobellia sp. WGM2]|uniref:ribonuclease P protein component n=1 Tax=Pseudozobellia sp. WGM2 TaxID=2787625 RepID=UPI001AE071EC|nr:ribonuclease P protein component [Pseudozobellia sp. WGM2]
MDFKFSKKEKLKSKKLIDQLFAEGKSVTAFPLKLIYLRSQLPENVQVQAGVAVPKKNIKSAVNRNRIKRLMRENYRLNKHQVFNNSEGSFAFLFLYLGKKMPSFTEIESAMGKTLSKFLRAEGLKSEKINPK